MFLEPGTRAIRWSFLICASDALFFSNPKVEAAVNSCCCKCLGKKNRLGASEELLKDFNSTLLPGL
jgi:hypothetical protein